MGVGLGLRLGLAVDLRRHGLQPLLLPVAVAQLDLVRVRVRVRARARARGQG